MRYVRARVHLRHVYPSRFGLGGYIGESRPENWLGTMDRENFTKGREGEGGRCARGRWDGDGSVNVCISAPRTLIIRSFSSGSAATLRTCSFQVFGDRV